MATVGFSRNVSSAGLNKVCFTGFVWTLALTTSHRLQILILPTLLSLVVHQWEPPLLPPLARHRLLLDPRAGPASSEAVGWTVASFCWVTCLPASGRKPILMGQIYLLCFFIPDQVQWILIFIWIVIRIQDSLELWHLKFQNLESKAGSQL